MNLVQNSFQNNINFDARFRLRKSSRIKQLMFSSTVGTWSTGVASGYEYGQHGIDVFKPSRIEEKFENTSQEINSKASSIKSGIEEKTNKVKEFFNHKKDSI